MTNEQWESVENQLPTGTKILRHYNAFENGEIRIIVKIPGIEYEQRYVAHIERGDDVRLEHRP